MAWSTILGLLGKDGIYKRFPKETIVREMPWLASRVGISGLPRGSGLTGRCLVRTFPTGGKGHESWGLMEPKPMGLPYDQ